MCVSRKRQMTPRNVEEETQLMNEYEKVSIGKYKLN